MTDKALPEAYRSLLVAEVGTALTRVTLVDGVDNTYRLIARAETWSTVAPPSNDLTVGILAAVATIEETTGRQLLRDGNLIIPMNDQGSGVEQIVVSTSAGGVLTVLILGLSAERSARAAQHASRATYSQILNTFALDEAGSAQGDWVNRQIVQLAQRRPDVIVLTGGIEGSAIAPLRRLAEIVRLIEQQHTPPPSVVLAGNSSAVEQVKQVFDSERAADHC